MLASGRAVIGGRGIAVAWVEALDRTLARAGFLVPPHDPVVGVSNSIRGSGHREPTGPSASANPLAQALGRAAVKGGWMLSKRGSSVRNRRRPDNYGQGSNRRAGQAPSRQRVGRGLETPSACAHPLCASLLSIRCLFMLARQRARPWRGRGAALETRPCPARAKERR